MSTWISSPRRRVAALCAVAALLAACQFDPARQLAQPDDPPPSRMAVADGAIIIAGPAGYCIDRVASRDRRDTSALAVLSSCRALGGGLFARAPAQPAILTATVAASAANLPVAAVGPGLAGFLASPHGLALISRAGDAATVTMLDTRQDGDALLLHLRDSAPFPGGAVAPDYWRALLHLGGRTVTLAVLAPADAPIGKEDGFAILRSFVASARAATANPPKSGS